MVFSNLIKLNSVVVDGFLMNKIISRYKSDNRSLETEVDKSILGNALKYIQLIKNFKDFIEKNKVIDNLQESAEAYSFSFDGLKSEGMEDFNIEKFHNIIKLSEDQVKVSLDKEILIEENLEIALKLFSAIRKQLVKKSKSISIQKRIFF